MSSEMKHNANPAWVVRAVEAQGDYSLKILFNDGTWRIFDASEYIKNPRLAALQNKAIFQRAHIVGPSVAWSDELDIAPEYLYENSQIISE